LLWLAADRDHDHPKRRVADKNLQGTRLKVIESLIREKVILRIEPAVEVSSVYVLPRFEALTFDDKRMFMDVCYSFSFALPQDATKVDHADSVLLIRDAISNEQVAHFSGRFGFKMD